MDCNHRSVSVHTARGSNAAATGAPGRLAVANNQASCQEKETPISDNRKPA